MIQIESASLTARVARLAQASDNVKRDMRRAMGTQKRVVQVEAPRAITAVYNITATRVRKSMKVGNVDTNSLSVTLTGKRDSIGLRQYGARALGRRSAKKTGSGALGGRRGSSGGVSVKVLKGGQRERLRHAFIAKDRAFQRESAAVPRLPIEVLSGPSVADHLDSPKVFQPLSAAFLRRAREEVNRLIVNALESRG